MLTAEISKETFLSSNVLDRIRLIDAIYSDRVIHLSSMQKTAGVLMHMIYRARSRAKIVFIDTQLHFPQTLEVRDQFREKYGLDIVTVTPELTPEEQNKKYGTELHRFVDGQPLCCHLRKELPLFNAVKKFRAKALITGLMRTEGNGRTDVQPVGSDPRIGCVVFNPLFDWSVNQVDDYLRQHGVPIHPFYAKSYASIGCAPCTTPINPGENDRAGRWRHLSEPNGSQPLYCNINYSDKLNETQKKI